MKKIVVLLVVLLGCMPVTAFAQKQFFFKDGRFVVAHTGHRTKRIKRYIE